MMQIPVFVFVSLLVSFVVAVAGLIALGVLDGKRTKEVEKLERRNKNFEAERTVKTDVINNYAEAMGNLRIIAPNLFSLFSKIDTDYEGGPFGYRYPITRTTWDLAKLQRIARKQSEVSKADRATIELLDEGSF